ncbi:hypothetical protein KP509_01G122600 [Ceratopteris richardii]|nr:hypothetical protein KP509_01G122600 [Ceratopteris richardii]
MQPGVKREGDRGKESSFDTVRFKREGDRGKESSFDTVHLHSGLWNIKGEEQKLNFSENCSNHFSEVLESKNDTRIPASDMKQKQAAEVCRVDKLVDKLVSQLNLFPESSLCCEGENQVLSSQKGATFGVHISRIAEDAKLSTNATSEYAGSASLTVLPELAITSTDNHSVSIRLKSAVRGSHEKLGLGPRLKMHVTWAPDVYDPPCSSASHTISINSGRNHHTKGERKIQHQGRRSHHTDSPKKSQKKLSRRLKYAGHLCGEVQNNVFMSDYLLSSFDNFKLKGPRVGPLISTENACFWSPMFVLGECELACLDAI